MHSFRGEAKGIKKDQVRGERKTMKEPILMTAEK